MGEGAGVVVLEEYEHAKARGAKIYAELVGYVGDACRIHRAHFDSDGAFRCMKAATKRAALRQARSTTLTPTARLDAAGDALGWTGGRQCREPNFDVLDQIVDRPSAQRGRGDFLDPGDAGRRRAADAQYSDNPSGGSADRSGAA